MEQRLGLGCTEPLEDHGSIMDTAKTLADRLQQLAGAATSAAQVQSALPLEMRSCGVVTELSGDELVAFEEAGALLSAAEVDVTRLRDRVASARAREDEAVQECTVAEEEMCHCVEDAEAAAAATLELDAPWRAEADARRCGIKDAARRVAEEEEEAESVRATSAMRAASDERVAAELRKELAEAEACASNLRSEAAQLAGDASVTTKAAAAVKVLAAAEEAEERGEQLEEERVRLEEEVGTLRFSLKDMNSFRHRRVQELNSQVQKLERQRRKLEAEQAQAWSSRSEEVSAGQLTRLRHLQQLNDRLTAQVQEAQQDRFAKEEATERLVVEHEELRQRNKQEVEESATLQERLLAGLDELSERDRSMKSEVKQLQARKRMMIEQLDGVWNTEKEMEFQLAEAEASLGRKREQEQVAEETAEHLHWKVELAATELGNSKSYHSLSRSLRGGGLGNVRAGVVGTVRTLHDEAITSGDSAVGSEHGGGSISLAGEGFPQAPQSAVSPNTQR